MLPKLNSEQMGLLTDHLKGKGFVIRQGAPIRANAEGKAIGLDPSGLCWSRTDHSDFLFPAIPTLLAFPKQRVSLESLKSRYFAMTFSNSAATVRMRPRLEGGPLWTELRAGGQCALAPDERAVIDFLLSRTSGGIDLVTDFPMGDFRTRVVRGKQFYQTRLDPSLARSTMAGLESQGARNSYLPKRGVLELPSYRLPSKKEYLDLFESLGEWCYFRAA